MLSDRVRPFHRSYTERHSCHEHTSEARLGRRAVLRRRLSVRPGHGCHPRLPASARREPRGYRLVGPGWAPMDAQVPLGAGRGRLGPPAHVGLGLPSADGSAAHRPRRLARARGGVAPLEQFFARPGFLAVAAFVLTFKLGDMAIGPMIKPFWVDRQFTPVQIGLVPGTLGVVATIGGALIGGSLTSRWGIFRALWVLGIFQAVSNLVYAAAAALPPNAALMYVASLVESFCGGLGTAPFLAFLIGICSKAHAATQYALLSALFGLTRALSGAFSGVATEEMGYAAYFTATFFLSWPAFLLLAWVKDWAGNGQEKGEGP